MDIVVIDATLQLDVTYTELQTIQAALMSSDDTDALELGQSLEDNLCCLLL